MYGKASRKKKGGALEDARELSSTGQQSFLFLKQVLLSYFEPFSYQTINFW